VGASEVRYAIHDDISIAFTVFGDGPRDVVLQQSLCPVDMLWELPQLASFLHALGRFARVIAYDARGTGASDSILDPVGMTIESSDDDVLAVLDAAESERASFFSMMSSGASVLAATRSDRIGSLILTHPRASYPEFRGMSVAKRKRLARALATVDALRRANPRAAHDVALQEWWGRAHRLTSSPEQTARNLEFAASVDVEAVLPAIRVPTLILHRRDNRLWDLEHSRAFANRLANARLVELPGSETDLFLGDTGPVLVEIEAFLREQDERAGQNVSTLDRVLATVMFTDMVSSTEQLASQGDGAWRGVLDKHDESVDRIVSEYRGRLVKSTGDGILAVFDGPARAVRCAGALLAAADQQGITLRAGLHTGEIELRSLDVAGIAVHTASRIADLARPNEVLVSRTVVDLTAGSGLRFEPRGEHELKGVPGTWPTFAAQPPDDKSPAP
jgi:class 3 adenylate cyclase